jgi:hypothetical protein
MESGKWELASRAGCCGTHHARGWPFLACTVAFTLFTSCASPGDPTTRRPPIPQAVTDLATTRNGNDVVLTFTLPKDTVSHRPLDQPPAITIYRDFEPASSIGKNHPSVPPNPTVLVTIPAAMAPNFSSQGHVRYSDSFRGGDFANHAGMVAVYTVQTSISRKAASANSNVVAVPVEPAADPIKDLKAEATRSGVTLEWTPPGKTFLPPTATIALYRIYRGEAGSAPLSTNPAASTHGQSATASKGDTASPAATPALAKIGETESPPFGDTQTEFNGTYVYSVRSVAQSAGETVESGDSNLVVITPKDVFPPSAPLGLVATEVPGQGGIAAHLELSWAINPETDVAGYNIYRADQPGAPGVRLNKELLLTPAFRDMNVQPGQAYFYSVTAVDRAGNESAPSAAVSASLAAENQKTP